MKFTILRASWSPKLQSVFRIMVGLLFLEHGTGKIRISRCCPGIDKMPHGLLLFTGFMELIGGALIVLGLFTRPVAFVLSGFMAAAYFMAHFPQGFFPVLNYGEAAVLYCFAYLYLATSGPGPISLDAVLAGSDERLGAVKS